MAKSKQKTFQVLAKLVLDVGFKVSAGSLQEALAKAQALKMHEILNFKATGLDHNDSEDPVITGVFQ
jgi:hypothetical protein